MRKYSIFLFLSLFFFNSNGEEEPPLPKGFVYLKNVVKDANIQLKYHSNHNFIGKVIDGYQSNKCLLTLEAASALKKVQNELKPYGLGIKIYDAYRPQRAVKQIVSWAKDKNDLKMKKLFYPNIKKEELIKKGYIASQSSHSRGSTVDLTIIISSKNLEIDMGSSYDLFDVISHTTYSKISPQQKANRLLLNLLMKKHGFKSYQKEWWHFTLIKEPFKDKYFDFIIQ